MSTITRFTTQSGSPRWQVRYDVYLNGRRVQKKRNFTTSKAAKDFAATTEAAILAGRYADARGLTVGRYLEIWLETYTTHCRPNTRKGYALAIEKHLAPRLGGERLENLTTARIQQSYNDMLQTEYAPAKYEERGGLQVLIKPAKTYSPKMVHNAHAVLRMALEQARKEGLISRNPADDVKLPASKPVEYTIPTPEQLRLLLDELRQAECYLAVLTCALLACRRGEALGLYWSDIDFEAGTIELKRALIVNNETNRVELGELKTKNSRRVLPLPSALRDALLKLKAEQEEAARAAGAHVLSSPFVFVTVEGKPFRPDSISQAFKRAARRAGLPDMRLHDLRHTGITYMLASGADPKTVSGFVGHATAQFTLNQYAHVMEQTKQRAGLLLENAVLPMGENDAPSPFQPVPEGTKRAQEGTKRAQKVQNNA